MIQLEGTWLAELEHEFQQDYFKTLKAFLLHEKAQGKTIYPDGKQIFNALNYTPFHDVKIVILGQDPYHGPNQAHGLSFSVRQGVAIPPSLQNIFKELKKDYPEFRIPESGDLSHWAAQGVLLLNSVLTVEANKPASHAHQGWEYFTDRIIEILSSKKSNLIFMLWGNYARQKKALIKDNQHLILEAAHPSPFSYFKGFAGCGHFKTANAFLLKQSKEPIIY